MWPVAGHHLAVVVEDNIWLWGGYQVDTSGDDDDDDQHYLPGQIFWVINCHLAWKRLLTQGPSGQIIVVAQAKQNYSYLRDDHNPVDNKGVEEVYTDPPPGMRGACATIIGTEVCMFGGLTELGEYNEHLFAMDTTTNKWRVKVSIGIVLVGRFSANCWTDGKNFYVFGGTRLGGNGATGLNGGDWSGSYTNQLAKYAMEEKTWENLETAGRAPIPRCSAGQASLCGFQIRYTY